MAKATDVPDSAYYVIGIGGSGSKIIESMVYAAALDLFTYRDTIAETDRVIEKIEMLTLDVDASCGNTDRMHDVLLHYQEIQRLFEQNDWKHRGFNTELTHKNWTTDSGQMAGVEAIVYNSPEEHLLAHAIYSRGESRLAYDNGFHGHPNLGVLFFRYHLDQLRQKDAQGKEDEVNKTLALIREDLGSGKVVRVLVAGSVFGGTGASGIPQITRFIREQFEEPEWQDRLLIGGIFMLPFYHVPETLKVEYELTIESDKFMEKAGTALQHYGINGAIRKTVDNPEGAVKKKGIFDAVYLLGLREDQFLFTRRYASGSKEQRNEAHLLEWLASRCAAHFFYTDFIHQDNRDCYHYEIHADRFDWTCFYTETERYRRAYGGLMDAAAVYVAECHPYLSKKLASGGGRFTGCVNYYAGYFIGARDTASDCLADLEHLLSFLKYYVSWMCQVLRTMPPAIRRQTAEEKDFQNVAVKYARLLAEGANDAALLASMENISRTDKIIICQRQRDALSERWRTYQKIQRDAEDVLESAKKLSIPEEEIETLKSNKAAAAAEAVRTKELWDRNQKLLSQCLILPIHPDEGAAARWEIPENGLFDSKWLQDLERMFIDAAAGRVSRRETYRRGKRVLQKIEKREEILMRLGQPSERIKRKASPAKRVSSFIAGLIYMIGSEGSL